MVLHPAVRGTVCLARTPYLFRTVLCSTPLPLRPSRPWLRPVVAVAPESYPRFLSSSGNSAERSAHPPPTADVEVGYDAEQVMTEPRPAAPEATEPEALQPKITRLDDLLDFTTSPAASPKSRTNRQHDDDGTSSSPSSSSEEPAVSSTWYLDVEPPRHPTLIPPPIQLPDTPADSPAVVEPLIKYTAEDLGLDELNLLDLREVDPPPALGPSLLMLFGTARSERHLHVSADRLVRWCRARGIHADADGLLGRNELKIKLRRLARKAKMLGDSSSSAFVGPDGKRDDGISTGWVCVNMGTLNWHMEEAVKADEEGRPSGFGSPVQGTTVVVQMMTAGRREELGLERLWGGILKKSIRDKEEMEEAVERAALLPPDSSEHKGNHKSRRRRNQPSSFEQTLRQQRRSLSTTSAFARTAADSLPIPPGAPPLPGSRIGLVPNETAKTTTTRADEPTLPTIYNALLYNKDEKLQLMDKLLAYLADLSRHDPAAAAKAVESSSMNQPRTSFLSLCDVALSHLPPPETFSFRVRLAVATLKLHRRRRGNHHTADAATTELCELVDLLASSGLPLTRADALETTEALFAASAWTSAEAAAEARARLLVRPRIDVLLGTMHERGIATLANDVLFAMMRGLAADVSSSSGLSTEQQKDSIAKRRLLRRDIARLRDAARLPCPTDAELWSLLEKLGPAPAPAPAPLSPSGGGPAGSHHHASSISRWEAEDEKEFWEIWGLPDRYTTTTTTTSTVTGTTTTNLGRSRDLYWRLFRMVTKSEDPRFAQTALRRCVSEALAQEQPRVFLRGLTADTLRRCVRLADPKAETVAATFRAGRVVEGQVPEFVRILLALEDY